MYYKDIIFNPPNGGGGINMIKYIYILFTGLLIAFFVGIGIATFYPGPEQPEYPRELNEIEQPNATQAAQNQAAQDKYDAEYEQYEKLSSEYERNVSIILVIFSITLLVLSLGVMRNMPIIADGTLLGGLFTLFHAVVRGVIADDAKFRFLIISISLLIALIMGYIYFVKPHQAMEGAKVKKKK